jgi:hypothetical protein
VKRLGARDDVGATVRQPSLLGGGVAIFDVRGLARGGEHLQVVLDADHPVRVRYPGDGRDAGSAAKVDDEPWRSCRRKRAEQSDARVTIAQPAA